MRSPWSWVAVIAAALVVLALGVLAGRSSVSPARHDHEPHPAAQGERREQPHGAGPSDLAFAAEPATDARRTLSAERSAQRERERGEEPAAQAASPPDSDPATPNLLEIEQLRDELEALRKDYTELREEQVELLGKPISPPPDGIEPRFSGPALTGSVGQAIGQSGVAGEVQHVDCSEYPCIVFGRLVGDEEDMEEIERAAALSEYDADVLTLLFWATTADSSEAAGPKETGLFALAFYTSDDRASSGAELDRRIRARTVEFWNTDRPGRPSAVALD